MWECVTMQIGINSALLKEILAIESYGDDDGEMLAAIKGEIDRISKGSAADSMRT